LEIDDPAGYSLLHELSPGRTLLCSDASGNVVVLKRLEDDCLHRRQLHPAIKDRLTHVRELAHPRIATLRTVERWDGSAHLVWTFLDGEIWDDFPATSNQHVLELIAALAATVDALHENGIVHGSLHGRNIIVRPGNQVWLTHVSPYLYADRQVDIDAACELIRGKIPEALSAKLVSVVEQLESGEISLREFSHLVLDLDQKPAALEPQRAHKTHGYRISSLLMAAALTAMAVVAWVSIQKLEAKSGPVGPTTFPSLRH
jgi:serine/threonine protein kinase